MDADAKKLQDTIMADADVALATIAVCGSSFCSSAAADAAMDADANPISKINYSLR